MNEIIENYQNPDFSVEEVAIRYGISSVHLRRLFHEVYRESPKRLLLSFRTGRAREMLHETDSPISEIAERCGFGSAY